MSPGSPISADVARLRLTATRIRYQKEGASPLERYRFDPRGYIEQQFGWQPWQGTPEQPGQVEVLEAYTLALRQQLERDAYARGSCPENELKYWKPGQVIQNWLRIEAGHTVGKTKLTSGIVNHFFDCFVPSILYTFAPTKPQIHDLLWKEIKADRRHKPLPGRILDLELRRADNHFAIGRATNNASGTGTERIQGQHGKYLLFALDEAEGIADYVWDAVKSMTSGGIVIVVILANPRTRTSQFHKVRELPHVRNFRVSCIWHPNVLAGREIVPGAVRREYVESMVLEHCAIVPAHDETAHTFSLPFDVPTVDGALPAGTIFKPDPEMLFRVLGIAPASIADNTVIPLGSYEAATKRAHTPGKEPARIARMGVDVARFGKDYGTLYINHDRRVWRAGSFYHQDTVEYAVAIQQQARELHSAAGVRSLHIRIDGGGGFGGGVIDQLARDVALIRLFDDFQVLEVHFNGAPYHGEAVADMATEMYVQAAESIKGLAITEPPGELEADLCERSYRWANWRGVAVKRLEPKDDFKRRMGRSPDDGDGFVLAVAPDFIFEQDQVVNYDDRVHIGSPSWRDDDEWGEMDGIRISSY